MERTGKRFGLGIDVGGTFTDIVVYDAVSGRQASHKELTTHDDPSEGVMAGIDRVLRESAIAPADIGRLVHATTLFSNALIERKGAPTGLITTRGFRDTLEIGRERKYELYDIRIIKPAPLVPRRLRLEVPERMAVDGSVRIPLDEDAVLAAAARLTAEGVTSLAIVFLHSYANPAHERQACELLAKRYPNLTLSASIEVAPEIREYERVSTTVINAYIKPLAERYIAALSERIAGRGIAAPLLLMLSNGGLAGIEEAKRTPVQLLESGPAAGALVAAHLGAADGGKHVLAFDMGGTTAKLSIVDDGKPTVAYSFEAAREKRFVEGSGLPVRISTLELIEIGAGGGSIAHLDDIGLLKVGPVSAGSEPGPAAYGRGGTQPTVTDADFVLGYLNPPISSAALWPIDMGAAEAAMRPLAERAGLSVAGLAWGIHDVVNENMASAARVHLAEHGKDPRRYALLCTGGAGPVHAYYVAKKLGLRRLIAPRGRRRRLGARPADRAGSRRPRGDGGARDGPGGVARSGGDVRAARGRCKGRARRHAAGRRRARHRAAGRHPLRRAGLRAGRAAARRTLHGRLARRADAGVRGQLRRRLHAHAADDPGRDHQRTRLRQHRDCGWGAADADRVSDAGGPGQGHAPRLLPRVPRVPPHHRLRPLRARGRGGLRRPRHRRGARVDPRRRPRRPLRGRPQRQHHRQPSGEQGRVAWHSPP